MVKVTMLKTMCGPEGNCFPGWVLDVDAKVAEELKKQRAARDYDHATDAKAARGLQKAAVVSK